jgi:hypothetical protein
MSIVMPKLRTGRPGRVVLDLAAVADPGRFAVGAAGCGTRAKRLVLRDRLGTAPQEHRPVVRMDQRGDAFTCRRESLGTQPEHLVRLRRPPQHVLADVEVERTHLAGAQRKAQALALLAQRLFGLPAARSRPP